MVTRSCYYVLGLVAVLVGAPREAAATCTGICAATPILPDCSVVPKAPDANDPTWSVHQWPVGEPLAVTLDCSKMCAAPGGPTVGSRVDPEIMAELLPTLGLYRYAGHFGKQEIPASFVATEKRCGPKQVIRYQGPPLPVGQKFTIEGKGLTPMTWNSPTFRTVPGVRRPLPTRRSHGCGCRILGTLDDAESGRWALTVALAFGVALARSRNISRAQASSLERL